MEYNYIEVYDAIAKINDEICKKVGYPYGAVPVITMSLGPTKNIVAYNFLSISVNVGPNSIIIYSSDEEDRNYNEKTDTYESWYKYIRRKSKYTRESFYSITL